MSISSTTKCLIQLISIQYFQTNEDYSNLQVNFTVISIKEYLKIIQKQKLQKINLIDNIKKMENEQDYDQEHVYEDEEDFKNYLYYEYYYQLIKNIQLPPHLFSDVYLAIIEKQMILVKDVIYFFEGEAQDKYNFIYENMKNFKQGVDYKLSFYYERKYGKISLDCLKQLLVLRNTEQSALFRDQIILMEQQLTKIIQYRNLQSIIPKRSLAII
ncbi:hypothetical protein ABPG72_019974 [Tetrahymena utriculariae]